MRICAFAGGVGSARFLSGLIRVVDPADLTLIANIGDDERIRGLHISPDIDTVLYHLTGTTDWAQGWGLGGETSVADDRYKQLAEQVGDIGVDLQEWFMLGDRDLATHQLRTRILDAGRPLSEATDAVRRALGVGCRVLPASDEPVRTKLITTTGERLDFQTYFVKRGQSDEIADVDYEGAPEASPAPGVIDALQTADVVIVPPSNPILTIGPILAIDPIREVLSGLRVPRFAVSPIIGGRAIKGPADRILGSLGHEVSSVGVHTYYDGLIDVLAVDVADDDITEPETGPRWKRLNTVMSGPEDAAVLAKALLGGAR
jgi:LPPG:FO 2-phospho-L-lactate transferase